MTTDRTEDRCAFEGCGEPRRHWSHNRAHRSRTHDFVELATNPAAPSDDEQPWPEIYRCHGCGKVADHPDAFEFCDEETITQYDRPSPVPRTPAPVQQIDAGAWAESITERIEERADEIVAVDDTTDIFIRASLFRVIAEEIERQLRSTP